MGLFGFKEFLSFDDVAEYLKSNNYYFDMTDEDHFYGLQSFLLDLINEKKLNVVFHYAGSANVSIMDFIGNDNEQDIAVIGNYTSMENGYFFLMDRYIQQIFNSDKILIIDENYILQNYTPNREHPIFNITDNEVTCKSPHFHKAPQKIELTFNDLKFPKIDLEKLFNPSFKTIDPITQTATNPDQSQQITDLTAQLASLKADNDRLTAENQQQADTIQQLNERLEAGTPAEPIADNEPLFNDLDLRTQNNFIRLLLAVNEMAKDKQGNYIDLDKEYNKEHTDLVNIKLDLLSYKPIKETAYKTLISLIKEKRAKGLQ